MQKLMGLAAVRLTQEFLVDLIYRGILVGAAVLGFFVINVDALCPLFANIVGAAIGLAPAAYAAAPACHDFHKVVGRFLPRIPRRACFVQHRRDVVARGCTRIA